MRVMRAVLLGAAWLAAEGAAPAAPIPYLAKDGVEYLVEYVTGSGDNESFLVADFSDLGFGPHMFTFVYLWPSAQTHTGDDLLNAVGAGGGLTTRLYFESFVNGNWLDMMSYGEGLGTLSGDGGGVLGQAPGWWYWVDGVGETPSEGGGSGDVIRWDPNGYGPTWARAGRRQLGCVEVLWGL